jgi:cytochrome c biogenesis protein ResB
VTAWGGRFYDFSISEGETIQLEGTNAFLTLEKFSVIPSATKEKADEYASRLRINRSGKPIEWRTLKVNSPLRIDGIRLYQARFNLDIENLRLGIFKGNDRKPFKFLSLGLNQRVMLPELNVAVEVKDFIPDFSIDQNSQVFTRSHLLRNPAAHLMIYAPAVSSSHSQETWIFRSLMPHRETGDEGEQLGFMLDDIQFRYTSGIKYARNPGEFVTYLGLILLVVGSFLSTSQFYRGLIITVNEDIPRAIVVVSAQAMKCKNMFAFEKEMNAIVKDMNLRGKGL